jgi:hypothetical protein
MLLLLVTTTINPLKMGITDGYSVNQVNIYTCYVTVDDNDQKVRGLKKWT